MSDSRILTTHAGSLPRPADLVELMLQHDRGDHPENGRFTQRVAEATTEVVQRQVSLGIDVPSDGEYSKASYATYVRDRLTGFNGAPRNPNPGFTSREFPDFERRYSSPVQFPTCDGPVELRDGSQVRQDIATLETALRHANHDQAFMSAASPGVIETFMPTTYYASDRAYLEALAAAMADEYRAIVDAGFVLQIDCPDLAMSRTTRFAALSDAEFRSLARLHVEALNQAIDGLPRARMRLHLCWGNYEGPHNHDIPLREILDIALEANVGGLSFEAANPRHAHEWRVFQDTSLPDDLVLIPGVIDTCTNYIEHPELVAQRIRHFVDIVGPERVIAGTDCGFGTSVGARHVAPSIAWAKLGSLVDGAALASATAG
ncbi:MAG: cobalamin-independent methionine synthase II family protein [Chloroflexi bacterium]|nr:cobalamin-independent methionine synthase II family protein [Chloroflexota bacterium]